MCETLFSHVLTRHWLDAIVCVFASLACSHTSLAWRPVVLVFLSLCLLVCVYFFVRTNGDSFYEYLLKMYILWGDVRYWDMFMQTYVSLQVGEARKARADHREGKARGVPLHAKP